MAKLTGHLFARLALDYFDHPKIAGLSDGAIVAHLEMLVYARKYLTDGVIPMRIAMRFASEVLDELASNDPENPSITRCDDGSVVLYGYEDFQETKEQVESRRRSRKESAEARWSKDAKRNAPRNAKRTAPSTAPRNAETETETENSPTESVPRKRGAHQIPDDWAPTPEHRQLAAARGVDIDLEIAKVRDWSKGGNNRRLDWDAVVRNWLRNARPERGHQQRPNRDAASRDALVQAHFDMQQTGGMP